MGVGDEVSDVTSVSTVLQQCTGKVVRLNIQFEITYSTTVVESNTTMALVVLMERCNFVIAGTETEATGHFTLQRIYKGVPYLHYLSERRGLVVKKLDSQSRCPVQRHLSVKYILGRAIKVQGRGLKFLYLIIHHEVLKLKPFSQQDLADKTAQKPKVRQFESTAFQDQQQQRHLAATTTAPTSRMSYYGKGK